MEASHSNATTLLRAIHEVKYSFNFEGVKTDFIIIKCDKEFAGEEVVDVVIYEHHDAVYSVARQYCHMLHVEKISSGKHTQTCPELIFSTCSIWQYCLATE